MTNDFDHLTALQRLAKIDQVKMYFYCDGDCFLFQFSPEVGKPANPPFHLTPTFSRDCFEQLVAEDYIKFTDTIVIEIGRHKIRFYVIQLTFKGLWMDYALSQK